MRIKLVDILNEHMSTIVELCSKFGFSNPRYLYLSETEEDAEIFRLFVEGTGVDSITATLFSRKLEALLKVNCTVVSTENTYDNERIYFMEASLPLESSLTDYKEFFSEDPGGFTEISFKTLDESVFDSLFKSILAIANSILENTPGTLSP